VDDREGVVLSAGAVELERGMFCADLEAESFNVGVFDPDRFIRCAMGSVYQQGDGINNKTDGSNLSPCN
jgi:hypothetical protein